MPDKVIEPLHPLQYPWLGQNYVFNGCMKFLMECVGEQNEAYDYSFFSAVSGDAYVQVFNTDKTKWSTCFSQSRFDEALIRRVFGSIGYEYDFFDTQAVRAQPEIVRRRLVDSIDRGIPVIGHGFFSDLPTYEVSCAVGYDGEGEVFYRLTEETTDLIPFTLGDGLDYSFVFIGEKKQAPAPAQALRNALLRAPELMHTPAEGSVHFGSDAFRTWANMLEDGFCRMTKEEFDRSIGGWRYYCIYLCNASTNIASKASSVDRAIGLNTDFSALAPLIGREYEQLSALEKELNAVGGGFDTSYEDLQNEEKCRQIAEILRKFAPVWERIAALIEKHS